MRDRPGRDMHACNRKGVEQKYVVPQLSKMNKHEEKSIEKQSQRKRETWDEEFENKILRQAVKEMYERTLQLILGADDRS